MIFGFEARHSWGKSLNLSEPQFAHWQNGSDDNSVVGNDINIFSMCLIENVCPVQYSFLSNSHWVLHVS